MIPSDPLSVPTKIEENFEFTDNAEGSHRQFHQQIDTDKEQNISQFCCRRVDSPGHSPRASVMTTDK